MHGIVVGVEVDSLVSLYSEFVRVALESDFAALMARKQRSRRLKKIELEVDVIFCGYGDAIAEG
jgi:hypothetical protein